MAAPPAWETWDHEEHLKGIDYLPQESANFIDVWVYDKRSISDDLQVWLNIFHAII
jgi:hypothetical protein